MSLCQWPTWSRSPKWANLGLARPASVNSIGNRPISPSGLGACSAPSACPTNCEPRQTPTTALPAAMQRAMNSCSAAASKCGHSSVVVDGDCGPPMTIRRSMPATSCGNGSPA
jgi:hypothetical protein